MKKRLTSIAGPVAFLVVYVFLGPRMFTSCGTTGDYALERLSACRPAAELLGEDIHYSYGMSCGSFESQGSMERSSVRLPVAGSRARGTYSYSADRIGTNIRFAGQLETGGKTIDIGTCREVGE
jgi:hypothetical protein